MEHNFLTYEWIPFKRYVLRFQIDDNKKIILGRFRCKSSAQKIKDQLSAYKGYKLKIVDTKKLQFWLDKRAKEKLENECAAM